MTQSWPGRYYTEHLQSTWRVFNCMVKLGHVPASFGQSYTVPLLKTGSNAHGKSVTVNDFRGISISPVISKIFEHCTVVLCTTIVILLQI